MKEVRRSKIIPVILKILQEGAESAADILRTMISPRGIGHRRAWLSMMGYRKTDKFETDWVKWYEDRQRFYSLLNYLKEDGLIARKIRNGNSGWHLTRAGHRKLDKYNKAFFIAGTAASTKGKTVIISYDIPEGKRKDRAWIREILLMLDFSPIHKSVWFGNSVLPDFFLSDLRERGLLNFVEVFEVGSRGTLKRYSLDK